MLCLAPSWLLCRSVKQENQSGTLLCLKKEPSLKNHLDIGFCPLGNLRGQGSRAVGLGFHPLCWRRGWHHCLGLSCHPCSAHPIPCCPLSQPSSRVPHLPRPCAIPLSPTSAASATPDPPRSPFSPTLVPLPHSLTQLVTSISWPSPPSCPKGPHPRPSFRPFCVSPGPNPLSQA